jgi:GDPmannose 4,6-dehydratase
MFLPNRGGPTDRKAAKAKRVLGWEPKVTLPELAAEMIASDLAALRVEMELRERGNG